MELLEKMVCSQVVGREGARARVQGVHKRRRRRTENKDILEQYRKLRLVLPNISRHGKVTKVSGKSCDNLDCNMLSFQRSVVEEAILYIEQLERQLWRRLELTKMKLQMEPTGGGLN